MMKDEDLNKLPYNAVAFKASHNSEEREETITQQLQFNSTKPYEAGCSGIELDVLQAEKDWAWCVKHKGSYTEEKESSLFAYLQKLMGWMNRNPKHRIITLHIDLKNAPLEDAVFPERIDKYILTIIPRKKNISAK